MAIRTVHQAVEANDLRGAAAGLGDPYLRLLLGLGERDAERCFAALKASIASRRPAGGRAARPWTLAELRDIVRTALVPAAQARPGRAPSAGSEAAIVHLQARVRGYVTRQALRRRHEELAQYLGEALMIQAWWRMILQRRRYRAQLARRRIADAVLVQLQARCRGYAVRSVLRHRQQTLRASLGSIVRIQAWFRGVRERRCFETLMRASDESPPSVPMVRGYVRLLDPSDTDCREELELAQLRQRIVLGIRQNQQMEREIRQLDIKIGLVVQNRMQAQDVMHQSRRLFGRTRLSAGSIGVERAPSSSLLVLNKDNQQRLENYQHLFYLLQTRPEYLARLVYTLPQSRTSKFMENVILTVFNFAQNPREEYLLLKLFHHAVVEEMARVDVCADILTGNPTVLKMVVHYNRGARELSYLREVLQPLVIRVLDDKQLDLNTNPMEMYRQHINRLELETGAASALPHDRTIDQALQYDFVQRPFLERLAHIQSIARDFLHSIVASLERLPYGIRYITQQIRQLLRRKFPHVSEEELLKIVSNVLYYRYLNPAIIAPDAFDVIPAGAQSLMLPQQRRNLGEIAKLLQHAAAHQLFTGNLAYLSSLNGFVEELWQEFRGFFDRASTVVSPEEHFRIDEYTDMVAIAPPVIFISPREIYSTHRLLHEHLTRLTSGSPAGDPLVEILADLGPPPERPSSTIGVDAVGGGGGDVSDEADDEDGEMALTLVNKYTLDDGDAAVDARSTFVRAKRLLAQLMRFQRSAHSVRTLLTTPTTAQEELAFARFREAGRRLREAASQRPSPAPMSPRTMDAAEHETLASLKRSLCDALDVLAHHHHHHLVDPANDYAALGMCAARRAACAPRDGCARAVRAQCARSCTTCAVGTRIGWTARSSWRGCAHALPASIRSGCISRTK